MIGGHRKSSEYFSTSSVYAARSSRFETISYNSSTSLHNSNAIISLQKVILTLARFIFDTRGDPLITLREAQLDICRTCITYLSFDCFEYEDDAAIEESILSGDYVLFHYAATQWINQCNHCAQQPAERRETENLCQEIQGLIDTKQNSYQAMESNTTLNNLQEFKYFQNDWPELCAILSLENSFWKFEAPFINLKTGILKVFKAYFIHADKICQT